VSDANDPNPPRTSRGLGCVTKLAVLVLVLFLLFVFMGAGIGSGQIAALTALALGWLAFLQRTVPQITWNWDLVVMGVLCTAVVCFLGHRFASWLTISIARQRGLDWRWPWRWTICGLVGIGLSFLVGMCAGGIAHQVGWLSSQTESWYERRGEVFLDLRQLDGALQQAVLEADGDAEKVRQALRNPESGYLYKRRGEAPLPERFQVLLIVNSANKVAGAIVFPRDHAKHTRSQVMYSFEGKDDYLPMEKLPELIAKHQNQLLAL
jgi:hypothetical protein